MKVALWKFQIILLPDGLYVSGIIIKGRPSVQNEDDKSFATFKKVVKSYFIRPLKKHPIFLHYAGTHKELITGNNGEFSIRLDRELKEDISVSLSKNGAEIQLLQDYPVRFEEINTKYLVVSDIDDTILQSYATNSIKKLRHLLFRSPIKRKRIEATNEAFGKLRSSHFHFIYLSRSEYNLFNLITTFIKENKLPIGPIFLRKFTRWKKLFNQKGKYQFKFEILDELLSNFPNNKVIFFGDDSQYDLDTYVHFAKLFPDSISRIFIHRTKGKRSKKEIKWNLYENDLEGKVYFYNEFSQIENQINIIVNEAIISS